MTPNDYAAIPASVTFRGTTFGAQGPVTVTPKRREVNFRTVDGRNRRLVASIGYDVSVPVVATFAELLPFLSFYSDSLFGHSVGPHKFLAESINHSNEQITITAHPFTTGDAVTVAWDETPPTRASGSWSASTTYYVRSVSANVITLHPTSNDATNNTNTIGTTADGTGSFWICRQFTLAVHRKTGKKRTFYNAIVSKFPELVLSAGQLLWNGNLEFMCLPNFGSSSGSTDEVHFYADTTSAFTPPTFTNGDVRSADGATGAWGGTAPWDSFQCQDGFRVNFEPVWKMIGDGVWPDSIPILDDFKVTAKGRPLGIKVPNIDGIMDRDIGETLDGEDLTVTFGGYYITLVQAITDPGATLYSLMENPASELTWTAGGDGATDYKPPFGIGT